MTRKYGYRAIQTQTEKQKQRVSHYLQVAENIIDDADEKHRRRQSLCLVCCYVDGVEDSADDLSFFVSKNICRQCGADVDLKLRRSGR